jgi:hypothetical protein
MTQVTLSDLMAAIARLEAKTDAMNEKIDSLKVQTDKNFQEVKAEMDLLWKYNREQQTDIALLKQRQGPRVHWVTILAGVAGVAAVILTILNLIYVNQGPTP